MTSKRRQRNRLMSSSPSPPIPTDNLQMSYPNTSSSAEASTSLSQPVNNEQNNGGNSGVIGSVRNPNDRFIYESGPPTAHSILRTQPAFLGKLYKMLEDDGHNLICWSSNGEYFTVNNSDLFSKQILPQYFKHNNWQSFVRQLNMYGFSKINEMIHSNISYDNQTWDFKHPHFKRGDFQSLVLIKRKSVKQVPSGHLNTPSTSSHLLDYTSQVNDSEMDDNMTTDVPSSTATLQHSDNNTEVEDGGMDNRVIRLNQKVNQVSQNVAHLTSEMQDIKSLIHNQQNMINDLTDLLRSYYDVRSTATGSSDAVPLLLEEAPSQQMTTSLPSIHKLASNLHHGVNIDTPDPPTQSSHRLSYPYSSTSTTPFSESSSSYHHHYHHHHHYHTSLSNNPDTQRRRSSHPSSNNPIRPLLNSTLDPKNPFEHR